ncbi:MAG: LysR substrate-binding domain-containing protein, partial [Pseudomonadota bacterium]
IFDIAKAGQGPLGGVIKLGLPSTIGPNLLPLILPDLHKSHPDLALQLREDVPRKLPEALSSGTHDLLLIPLPIDGPDLVTHPIFREPLYVAMAEDHPLTARDQLTREDLRGQDVLALERGHQLQEQVAAICDEFGARLAFDFEGTSLDTLSQMTAMGTGITFLPGLYVERAVRGQGGIAIRELTGRALSRTIGDAWRTTSSRADDYVLLTDFVRSALAHHFPRFVLL